MRIATHFVYSKTFGMSFISFLSGIVIFLLILFYLSSLSKLSLQKIQYGDLDVESVFDSRHQ